MRCSLPALVMVMLPCGSWAQTAVRPGLVTQPNGAPLAIEATESVDGRLHARVRIRNLSDSPVTAVTVALTLGDAGAAEPTVYRRTETVAVSVRAGETDWIELAGIATDAVTTLLPQASTPLAEVGVLAVTWDTGRSWHLPSSAAWLGREDRPGTIRCLDASGAVHLVGDVVLDGSVLRKCAADGMLTSAVQ